MRISCEKTDPGYETFVRYGGHDSNLEIWFEGEKLDGCVTADTDEETVLVWHTEGEGIAKRTERRTFKGHVKIMLNGAVLASSRIPLTEEREWKPGDSPVLPEADLAPEMRLPVELGRIPAFFRVTGQSAWVGEDGVKRAAPEFTRIGTKTSEHNFTTACSVTVERLRELFQSLTPYQWGGKWWRVQELRETFPGQVNVRSLEVAERPATYFDLEGWVKGVPDMAARHDAFEATGDVSVYRRGLRPSIISKLLSRRRKLIASARKRSERPEDKAVGEAISAMTRKGRAHEF